MSERAGIAQIRAALRTRPGTVLGIGDDAAVLELGDPVLACHDLLVDGVHFRRATADLASVGHKALAANLSDIAAMGGIPRAALVGLTMPPEGIDAHELADLYVGMEGLADAHGVTIAGGDTTAGPALSLAVTVLGTLPVGAPPLTRSGALPGDLLCVTGPLGAAGAGLHLLEGGVRAAVAVRAAPELVAAHRRPVPRLAEGRALAAGGAHAGMDISDGLILDAARLLDESSVAGVIDLERVPRADGVAEVAAAVGVEPAEFAATAGEDYELLVAVARDHVDEMSALLPRPLVPVGNVLAGDGLTVRRHGRAVSLSAVGWELP